MQAQVANQLIMAGLQQAAVPADADWLVALSYGIDNGQVIVTQEPIWARSAMTCITAATWVADISTRPCSIRRPASSAYSRCRPPSIPARSQWIFRIAVCCKTTSSPSCMKAKHPSFAATRSGLDFALAGALVVPELSWFLRSDVDRADSAAAHHNASGHRASPRRALAA